MLELGEDPPRITACALAISRRWVTGPMLQRRSMTIGGLLGGPDLLQRVADHDGSRSHIPTDDGPRHVPHGPGVVLVSLVAGCQSDEQGVRFSARWRRQKTERRLGKEANRCPPGASSRTHCRSISLSASMYSITLDITISRARAPAEVFYEVRGQGEGKPAKIRHDAVLREALARASEHCLAAIDRDRLKATRHKLVREMSRAAAEVDRRRACAPGRHQAVDGRSP
ncbi:MAG TPA: hypothetical protein VF072_09970 [Thermoleophilaceae bacterium]